MIDELMDSLVLDKLPTLRSAATDAGRPVPRGRRHRPDPAQLQERAAAARRRPRHPGQGGHPRPRRGTLVRHRRGLPGADRRSANTTSWPQQVRPADDRRRRRTPAEPCELVILALGKFGGRELNYHSDLDLVFLYEADGTHRHRRRARARRHDHQPALLQRVGAADHQDRQPTGPLRPAVRSRCPAAPHRAKRLAGRPRSTSSAATSPRATASSGSGRRCARPGSFSAPPRAAELAVARDAPGGLRPPLAARKTPRKSARCGSGWKRPPRRAT